MFSENQVNSMPMQSRLKDSAINKWNNLSLNQKNLLKKTWSVLTYKWQWQIALNMPFMAIWVFDKTIPAVHEFDMRLLAAMPLPNWLLSFFGS